MKKYLPLYEKWMETGRIPNNGLCNSIGSRKLSVFRPSRKYSEARGYFHDYWYWGYDGKANYNLRLDYKWHKFTPLRQTIVLLMAAMAGELD